MPDVSNFEEQIRTLGLENLLKYYGTTHGGSHFVCFTVLLDSEYYPSRSSFKRLQTCIFPSGKVNTGHHMKPRKTTRTARNDGSALNLKQLVP
eukprot:2464930-Rhodomonas_salina.2